MGAAVVATAPPAPGVRPRRSLVRVLARQVAAGAARPVLEEHAERRPRRLAQVDHEEAVGPVGEVILDAPVVRFVGLDKRGVVETRDAQ